MKTKTYWTLASWEDHGWYPQFGDYTKSVVYQEFIDSYRGDGNHYRIVSSEPEQAAIMARLATLAPPERRSKLMKTFTVELYATLQVEAETEEGAEDAFGQLFAQWQGDMLVSHSVAVIEGVAPTTPIPMNVIVETA